MRNIYKIVFTGILLVFFTSTLLGEDLRINATAYSGNAQYLYFFYGEYKAKYNFAFDDLEHANENLDWFSDWGRDSFKEFDAAYHIPNSYNVAYLWKDEWVLANENTGAFLEKKTIVEQFPELETVDNFYSNFDGACSNGKGGVYLFKGGECVLISLESRKIVEKGAIKDIFQGLVGYENLDGATYTGNTNQVLLFKQNDYVLYDLAQQKIIEHGNTKERFSPLLAVSAPNFNPESWMTDAYPYIKDLKLKELCLSGSHNSFYFSNLLGDMCHTQYASPKMQFTKGGVRYFDLRCAANDEQFLSMHGDICVDENGFTSSLMELSAELNTAEKEIVILHIKQLKNLSTEKRIEFAELLKNTFGERIIKPSELPNGLFPSTLETLLSKGNVILVSEYDFEDASLCFRNERKEDNIGSYLSFPYVGENDKDVVATAFDNKLLRNQSQEEAGLFITQGHCGWSLSLMLTARDWNSWFYANRITQWFRKGYSFIHCMDNVTNDEGGANAIAKKMYVENIVRGIKNGANVSLPNDSLHQKSISELSRFELLKRYAPIIHMGVNTGSGYYDCQDLILGVDQDKNWGTYDDDKDVWAQGSNWPRTTCAKDVENINPLQNDITPIVYGSIIELSDFYLLSYELYHTYNEIAGIIGDHLNDIEAINVLIDKEGNIKGATSTVHSSSCWATPWSSDEEPSIWEDYNNKNYKLRITNDTHPHFWVGSNGVADLFYMTHGHAIFPFPTNMRKQGVDYVVAEDDIPVKPARIGDSDGWSYDSKCSYIIVPEEELILKGQMQKDIDSMYHLGQSMGTWSGQFWGNGYYGYVSEGDGTSKKHVRYRYNDSYSGEDMSFNYLYHPPKRIGIKNSNWTLEDIGGLQISSEIHSFYKQKYANLPGGGFFDNSGQLSKDLLSMHSTNEPDTSFSIEAMVRRVGKLYLKDGWFSNPYNKEYVNGTGPTGGIALFKNLTSGSNFIYVGWAPEKDSIVLMHRNNSSDGGVTKIEYLDLLSTKRYFKVEKSSNDTISIYVKDYRYPEQSWERIKHFAGAEFGLEGILNGALLTQSDVNSKKSYYWTNGEYDKIKLEGDATTLLTKASANREQQEDGKMPMPTGKKRTIDKAMLTEDLIKISPRVSDSWIYIDGLLGVEAMITLVTRKGSVVLRTNLCVIDGKSAINISHLRNAIYFINIRSEGQEKTTFIYKR